MDGLLERLAMDDPNAIYKTGFADLVLKLGRTPTMKDAELRDLHEGYKRAWEPAEEITNVSAAGPGTPCPSREPAPQARAIPRESSEGGEEPLSGPDKPETREGALSEPDSPPEYSGASERRLVTCRTCRAEFTRPARRGRPPVECELCR